MTQAAQVIAMQDQLIIQEFGIQEITAANIAIMEKQILEIPEKPETKEQYDSARRFNVDAKKLLPRIEERRKELKAPVLEKGKAIDDTAKKAVSMVQPLIELSGSRREAWEAEKALEKAEKDRIENERLASIQAKFDMLNHIADKAIEYNRPAADIEKDISNIDAFDINSVDFQERTNEAEWLKEDKLKAAKVALENRIVWERDQAELAMVKAEQEAERKRLEEERSKLEAYRKAQEEAARKAAEYEAEKRRQHEESIRAEREALEYEKAKAAHAAIVSERETVWDVAHHENIEFDHAAAIIENDRRKAEAQAAQADFEAAHAAALVEHDEYRKRQQLLAQDKLKIQEQINLIDTAISEIKPCDFATEEAAKVISDLYVDLKEALSFAEKLGSEIR